MKKQMKTILTLAMVLAILLTTMLPVAAAGTGPYSVTIRNPEGTGISIAGDEFHAFRLLDADDLTSYSVDVHFYDFFNKTMTGGNDVDYDFATLLAAKQAADADLATAPTDADKIAAAKVANENYNHTVAQYLDSLQDSGLYALAVALKTYLEEQMTADENFACDGHATVPTGKEEVTISGLEAGYFFVMNHNSLKPGLGVAASGAFVALGPDMEQNPYLDVKNSTPVVDKKILHNDKDGTVSTPSENKDGQWDIVGDYQIGDTADFLITSTLPSNIDDYTNYTYILSDEMSDGISYNGDVAIYLDKNLTMALDRNHYDISTPDGKIFVLNVNLKQMEQDGILWTPADKETGTEGAWTYKTLYTHYTGLVTEDANVSLDREQNTITLEFSNNPSDEESMGRDEDTVFQYTFKLNVDKIGEDQEGLAGAKFMLSLNQKQIKLRLHETVDGVDYYTPVTDENYAGDGLIVTRDNNGVIGKFAILGLDDAVEYTLSEVEAPAGYNAIEDILFTISAAYNETTGELTSLSDNSPVINNNNDRTGFHTTILNRKTILLPSTGGIGTIIFQVGGALLVLAAASIVLFSLKKKEKAKG